MMMNLNLSAFQNDQKKENELIVFGRIKHTLRYHQTGADRS